MTTAGTLVSSPPPLKLLDISLKPSGSIISSISGEFTAPSNYEIVVLRPGGIIELYCIDSSSASDEEEVEDSLILQTRIETFSVLRSITSLRLTGSKRDLVAVGCDSGLLTVLDFENCPRARPTLHHTPFFGKTQIRRAVPGQYIAVDPRGRAAMIASTEKSKLVYVVNRDSKNKLTIASPLVAHRNRTLCWGIVGVDNGYENPVFASLEILYPEEDHETTDDGGDATQAKPEKEIAYYELDLGLNHVSRKWAKGVPSSAFCMAALPGGGDGPSGVFIGCEDCILYVHDNCEILKCSIPQRNLHPSSSKVLIQSISVIRLKRNKFFALAQSELGDVFKVTCTVDNNVVTSLTISLLDTLRVGNALNITKSGLLFVASEFGNHELYRFERIDLEDAPTTTSSSTSPVKFTPTKLTNLKKRWSMESLSPSTSVLVGELAGNEVSPQIYTLCGRGSDSRLLVLRHGAAVTELAVSELPGTPGAVFTVCDSASSYDKYIVISFADATLVLSVGDTVEEVGEGTSGFQTKEPTLACCAFRQDGGICQVHPGGVRHIYKRRVNQWSCPGLKRIETASVNESQVLIALAGGEIIYFEADPTSGKLMEVSTREMGADVSCLDVGSVPSGKSRSLFAAVGCLDQTVRVISLMTDSLLIQKSSTALRALPHCVCLQQVGNPVKVGDTAEEDKDASNTLPDDTILSIGLEDGSFLRAEIDGVTGAIQSSPTKRFLGARPVSAVRISIRNRSCTLLLSSRPWISRPDPASMSLSSSHSSGIKYMTTPLSYTPLDHACKFSSEAVPEGIVATSGTTLRILTLEGNEVDAFNSQTIPLRYTPRQQCLLEHRQMVIVESDINEYSYEQKKRMGFDFSGGFGKTTKSSTGNNVNGGSGDTSKEAQDDDAMDMDMDMDEDSDNEEKPEKPKQEPKPQQEPNEDEEDQEELEEQKSARSTTIRGPVPSKPGTWGSCIRLLDPSNNCTTLDLVELQSNEAALCCCSVRFHSRGNEPLLAIGTVSNMTLHPVACTDAHVVLYRVINGDRLQLLHRTRVEAPVLALTQFCGRLLVGVGKILRLYEMGKKQLLRKCELRTLPTMVKTLQTAGDRAYVGDTMQSIHIIRYDNNQNRLVLVANDRVSTRYITSQELLDKNTIAASDKFGNVAVLRLPRGADESASADLSGTRTLWETSRRPGNDDTLAKLETLCHYYVGEVVTSMTRASLVAGGAEALLYVTVTGRIGALLPFHNREDIEFYQHLEACLRSVEALRSTGREPQAYRSYYAPIKHVVDGDLCEAYGKLTIEEQKNIAEKMDRNVGEILKKLEDTRNGLL